MNIQAMQMMLGATQQLMTQQPSMSNSQSQRVSFQQLLKGDGLAQAHTEETMHTSELDEVMVDLFNATTVEEVVNTLSVTEHVMSTDEVVDMLPVAEHATKLAGFIDEFPVAKYVTATDLLSIHQDENIDVLLQKMIGLLEDAEIVIDDEVAPYGNDLASLLQLIDQIAPMVFAQYANMLDDKGKLPKDNVVQLLAVFKTVDIVAPQKDLLLKQEQQLFTLQNYLTTASEQLATKIQAQTSELHIPRFIERQPMLQPIHVQAEPLVTSEQGQKESPKEVTQFAIHQVSGGKGEIPLTELDNKTAARTETLPGETEKVQQLSINQTVGSKGEPSITELENRGGARTETLLREMQAIFKRANFGQAGGTNRLLIKLYPEHLGQVRVELLQTNGVLTARLLASTALGKEMLDSQLNQLRQAFLQQNIQVERIEVAQTLQDTPRSDREQQQFQQHSEKRQQQSSNDKQNDQQDEEVTFEQFMIELEV